MSTPDSDFGPDLNDWMNSDGSTRLRLSMRPGHYSATPIEPKRCSGWLVLRETRWHRFKRMVLRRRAGSHDDRGER